MLRTYLLIVLVTSACSSTSGETAAQACQHVAEARCVELMTCSMTDLERRWPDEATCEARETLGCTENLAAPKTAATPKTVQACADALDAGTCAAFLSNTMPPQECLPPTGTAADASACETSAQCSSGFCAIPAGALCGTCAHVPAAGDSCATIGCGPSLRCANQTQLCVVPVAIGGACGRGTPCAVGAACVGASMMMVNGTCTAQVATAGAACDPKAKTAPDCDPSVGLACDTTSLQCVMQPVATAGMPCGQLGTVDTRCGGGATCAVATGSTTGTCVAPAADAAACDSALGPDCEFPARCITPDTTTTAGTCQLPGSTVCM